MSPKQRVLRAIPYAGCSESLDGWTVWTNTCCGGPTPRAVELATADTPQKAWRLAAHKHGAITATAPVVQPRKLK